MHMHHTDTVIKNDAGLFSSMTSIHIYSEVIQMRPFEDSKKCSTHPLIFLFKAVSKLTAEIKWVQSKL